MFPEKRIDIGTHYMKEEKKNNLYFNVPEPALRRLPWYLAFVKVLLAQNEPTVSSTVISRSVGVDAALVAKDLSYVNISGRTRVGYSVPELVDVLETFLGFSETHDAYIFGVGSLGSALLQDRGLSQYGLNVVGGFDVNPLITGQEIHNIPVYHLDQLPDVARDDVAVAVLTVPVDKAQKVTDFIVENSNISGIWNFTPFRLTVPERVAVQNTSLYSHLAVLFSRLRARKEATFDLEEG